MKKLELTERARSDIDRILRDSEGLFGPNTADRYRLLLAEALDAIRTEEGAALSIVRLGSAADLRTYPLRLAKSRIAPAERINRPRHVLVYRAYDDRVIVVRVLHDAMDFPRHLRGL